MTNRRGANTAQSHAATHPTSEILRVSRNTEANIEGWALEKPAPRETQRVIELDEDDLYGNMPFTD